MPLSSSAKSLQYYEWKDIEVFLCEKMGIENFRDVSNNPGHDYWHVWLDTFAGNIRNGTYQSIVLGDNDDIMERLEDFIDQRKDNDQKIKNGLSEYEERFGGVPNETIERIKNKTYDWVMDLYPALCSLRDEVGEEFVVYFYW